MLLFILKRLALAIPTLLILVTLSFFLIQTAPDRQESGDVLVAGERLPDE